MEVEKLAEENREYQTSAERLYAEREAHRQDLQLLAEERERYRAKLESVKKLNDYEGSKNRILKAEQTQRITQLIAEKKQLEDSNGRLRDEIARLDRFQMDDAAIEVARATKTI